MQVIDWFNDHLKKPENQPTEKPNPTEFPPAHVQGRFSRPSKAGAMIARTWHGVVPEAKASEHLTYILVQGRTAMTLQRKLAPADMTQA